MNGSRKNCRNWARGSNGFLNDFVQKFEVGKEFAAVMKIRLVKTSDAGFKPLLAKILGRRGLRAGDIEKRVVPVLVETGEHHRQQAPRRGVIDRAGTERNGAHRSPRQFLEMNDAGKHWESRDAHGCAEKQHGFRQ